MGLSKYVVPQLITPGVSVYQVAGRDLKRKSLSITVQRVSVVGGSGITLVYQQTAKPNWHVNTDGDIVTEAWYWNQQVISTGTECRGWLSMDGAPQIVLNVWMMFSGYLVDLQALPVGQTFSYSINVYQGFDLYKSTESNEGCEGVIDQITGEISYPGKCSDKHKRPDLYLGVAQMLDRAAEKKLSEGHDPLIRNTAFILNSGAILKVNDQSAATIEGAEIQSSSSESSAPTTGTSSPLPDDTDSWPQPIWTPTE